MNRPNGSNDQVVITVVVPESLAFSRLDRVLSTLCDQYSRTTLQKWIEAGYVTVDGQILRSRDIVEAGQQINIDATISAATAWKPQAIELNVVYEDQHISVINKPVGLVVHPGAGQTDSTLLNALLNRYPELELVPRAGIVHRLDKDTSGLLVVARDLVAQTKLVRALEKRQVTREYSAIVWGVMTAGGTVDAPIGRHPIKRVLMAVTPSGKPAVTHYRVIKRFLAHSHLKVILETGRTHQIRVHMAHIHYPIVGDQQYSGRLKLPAGISSEMRTYLQGCKRQALHAQRLKLAHPITGVEMEWEAPLPDDMQELLRMLGETIS